MAGTDAIYEALFRKYRVHRADTLEELFDFAKALAYLPKPKGRKLMITTSSGGAAILAIDEAEKAGAGRSRSPIPASEERLKEHAPGPLRRPATPLTSPATSSATPACTSRVMDETGSEYDYPGGHFRGPHPRGLPGR